MQLQINFNIKNFWKKSNYFNNVFFWHKRLSKNKSMEFEVIESSDNLFNFELEIVFSGKDHAGPSIVLGILGLDVGVRIYDHRHWDYQNDNWEED